MIASIVDSDCNSGITTVTSGDHGRTMPHRGPVAIPLWPGPTSYVMISVTLTQIPRTIRYRDTEWVGGSAASYREGTLAMSKHDQTRDGGRPSDQVDPSKIVRLKDDNGGRHSASSGDGPDDDEK
jgi:hypothetical protein